MMHVVRERRGHDDGNSVAENAVASTVTTWAGYATRRTQTPSRPEPEAGKKPAECFDHVTGVGTDHSTEWVFVWAEANHHGGTEWAAFRSERG